MMGDIVNLKATRKSQARGEKEKQAAANRAKFGRAKDQRKMTAAKRQLEARRLEGHKREE